MRLGADASASTARRGIAVGVDCAAGEPEVLGSHVLLAVGRAPTPTTRARGGGDRSTPRAISWSTSFRTSASPTYGRSAIATGAAPSPTLPITNSRSPRRTCSTARPARSAIAFRLRALYRSAVGRVGLTETEARAKGPGADRHAADDQGEARGREGRSLGLYEGCRRPR